MRGAVLGLLTLAALALIAAPASAILGESAERAAKRADTWNFRFGAYYSKIDTDAQGRAIRECWTSSADGWTETRALQFAGMLLPDAVRHETPQRVDERSGYIHYALPSGYAIDLRTGGQFVPSPTTPGVLVTRVVVRAPGVEGSECKR